MKYLATTFVFLLVHLSYLSAQNLQLDSLEAKIDEMIPPFVNDTTPGLVIRVVHQGELIYGKGFGLANLAYKMPNDTQGLIFLS